MKVAVIIPACRGREENVRAVLACLRAQTSHPDLVILVEDGPALEGQFNCRAEGIWRLRLPKHEPGMEQPRNEGVRLALRIDPEITHAWFLDSDVLVGPDCLAELEARVRAAPGAAIAAPYDWMYPGVREPMPNLYNDPRWAMFNERGDEIMREDLSAGLGCFSGNLLWPVDEFMRVGGFWAEIHHGRCEDGELGIRAVAMGVPIALAPKARGWHLNHPVNHELAMQRNARDVPMLNDRHPWMEGRGVFMVDRDGKAFNVRCRCGQEVPTIFWWDHAEDCEYGMSL